MYSFRLACRTENDTFKLDISLMCSGKSKEIDPRKAAEKPQGFSILWLSSLFLFVKEESIDGFHAGFWPHSLVDRSANTGIRKARVHAPLIPEIYFQAF